MRSGLRLLLAFILVFQAFAPLGAVAHAPNVLAPAQAPRAVASPPATLPHAMAAAVPGATIVRRPHVLAPASTPRAQASPPSLLRRITGNGFARGMRQAVQTTRSGLGVVRARANAGTAALISESFTGSATTASAWAYGDNACVTAGSSLTTPSTSVPACGSNAPQDPSGSGALQLTPPINYNDGFVFNKNPLASGNGLSITFDYFSFNASGTVGDGLALVLTNAASPVPTAIGGCCGSLGYAAHNAAAPLPNGYLGVGFDETGNFGVNSESKTGGISSYIANSITVRGAVNAQYLFSSSNSAGQAAALPFSLDTPAATTRPTALTFNVTLSAAGALSVSIDRHDGNGLITYIPATPIVGVNGQPAVPANVYLGFIAAGGNANARTQIRNVSVTTVAAPPTVAESFSGQATTAGAWTYGDNACLTAGTSSTPATSVPACGTNARPDSAGNGALQLTPPLHNKDGFVFNKTAFATSGGLSVTFNYYSFNTSDYAGDGLAFVLTDASKPLPSGIGGCCGSLGYAPYNNWSSAPALSNGYLGIGLDESGYFTAANEGKTGGVSGLIANAITVRGATSMNAQYLVSADNAAGKPASLPFALAAPAATTRPAGLAVNVTLSANGLISVAIDRHDGNGFVTYIPPTQVVGLNGQPGLPANVNFGFIAAGGGVNTRHQINNVTVTGAVAQSAAKTSVLTYHNDANRTGWNSLETQLTTANVNSSTFGLLHTVALDGRVDAQPLVVPNAPIAGQGTHDVIYVATGNNTVYAIDAKSGAILRSRNLGVSISNSAKDYDDNVYPTYGILSTPVIDLAANAIYVVTDANEGTSAPDVYRLHKLALNNLSDMTTPVAVTPSTTLSDGSTYTFMAQHERQRPGLLEANGIIYVAFGSTGDAQPTLSRGVIAGFSAATLAPLASNDYTDRQKDVSNPFYLSSIWQSGYGIAADSSGNVYFATGNSDPNVASYGPPYNYPDSVLKLSGNLGTVLDSFTQYNYFAEDQGDGDLGAGGTLVLPDQSGIYPHLVVAGGKDGRAYVLNRDNLGGYTAGGPNKDLAELSNGGCWCGPAYFVGADGVARIVTGGGNGVTSWKLVDGSSLSIALEGRVSSANTNGKPDNGGTIPVISSNGTTAGSGILWFVQRFNETSTYTLNLRAYDAANLANQLYASSAGNWTNQNSNANVVPTVANGHVYVASNKQLQIFGLLGQ